MSEQKPVSALSVADLVSAALVAMGDEERYGSVLHELQSRGTQETFQVAADLVAGPDPNRTVLGLDILSQLGYQEGRPFREQTFPILYEVAATATDPRILASLAIALGYSEDVRGAAPLLALLDHPDEQVRHAVACALPWAAGDPPSTPVVEGLQRLTEDPDAEVRDWATFGLGVLLDIDSPSIRQTLFARLDDEYEDAAGEALVGLARRGDSRIKSRLDTPADGWEERAAEAWQEIEKEQ